MIRTKAYILREIKRLESKKEKLEEELYLLNNMATQVGNMPFSNTKAVIKHELTIIEGKLSFAEWCANTSEKSLPKIKDKKKKRKEKKRETILKRGNLTVYPKDAVKSNKEVIEKAREKTKKK